MMNYQDFRNRLFEEVEEGYRDFVLTGIISERPLLGGRVPKCREIAKEILDGKFGGADAAIEGPAARLKNAEEFLKNEPVAFEEVAVRGYVIAALPYEEMVKRMYDFIQLIDNWEICDTFCAAMGKNIKRHREEFLSEIDKMIRSLDEFQTRVAYVCLLDHYIMDGYFAVVVDRINEISEFLSEGPGELSVVREKNGMGGVYKGSVIAWDAYYVKMAVAWLVSILFVKYPDETLVWFKGCKLPTWTYNKAIAKTCESLRVDKDLKKELKKLKR